MASKGRPGEEPDPFLARPGPGGAPRSSRGPEDWPAPGPDDPTAADLGPETGHWELGTDDEDLETDGTATWDGPMVWQDEEQGATWEGQDGAWDEAQGGAWDSQSGTWSQDGGSPAPTEYDAWRAGQGRSGPYGYENGYPTASGYPRSREEAPDAYTSYGDTALEPEWTGGSGGGGRRRPPRRANGPWPELVMITAVAVIIAAVILAVTSADRTHLANSQTSSTTLAPSTTSRSTSSTGHRTSSTALRSTSTVQRATTAPSSTTTVPATNQKAKNLLVTPGVNSSLVRSWLATNPGGVDLSPKDVAGTEPGQVYYAEQPASATYWALVAFKPSATLLQESSTAAGQEKLAEFQNNVYAFSWKSGPVWTLLGVVNTGSCPGVVPAPVLKVWGMCGL